MIDVNITQLIDLLNRLNSRANLADKLQKENDELHLNNALLKTELEKTLQMRLRVGSPEVINTFDRALLAAFDGFCIIKFVDDDKYFCRIIKAHEMYFGIGQTMDDAFRDAHANMTRKTL